MRRSWRRRCRSWGWRWHGRVSRCVAGKRWTASQRYASPRRMRAKAHSTIQPRARRSASAGLTGVVNLPAAEAAGTTPSNSHKKRDPYSSCGGRLRGRTFCTPPVPRARAAPSAGLTCACAPPRATVLRGRPADGLLENPKSFAPHEEIGGCPKITEDMPSVHPRTTSRNEPSAGIRPQAS
jgi:hypothetical protein